MTSWISHVAVDCANAYELSEWWKPVLGYVDVADDPNAPGHAECVIVDPDDERVNLIFIEVPEGKSVKNRLHLDLRPRDGVTRDQEVERLIGLGARQFDDQRKPDGTGWVVLQDPEGNEFCVLRSRAEVQASTQ
ncbi:MAG TPA: VOC family protein [Angustibacter sp.]|nr:VOC family protein [Angustibacter sp.]